MPVEISEYNVPFMDPSGTLVIGIWLAWSFKNFSAFSSYGEEKL
jgi:hypothetical protein